MEKQSDNFILGGFFIISALIYCIYNFIFKRTETREDTEKRTEMDSEIKIYRFGSDTPCITICKYDEMMETLKNIADILGSSSDNLQLFQNGRLLPEYGMISDHVNTDQVYVIEHQSSRSTHSLHFPVFYEPDMLQCNDGPTVRMPCGHFIAPESLYKCCLMQLESGSLNFTCPQLRDEQNSSDCCDEVWPLKDIERKASLSDDERIMFESMMNYNWIHRQNNIYSCPLCASFIDGTNLKGKCFNCRYCSINACRSCKQVVPRHQIMCMNINCKESLEKLRQTLRYCEKKTILDIHNCPSVRACPSCFFIVQHGGEECKHMVCPNKYCKTKFCFICLKIKTDKYYWPCGGAFESCQLSPVQTID